VTRTIPPLGLHCQVPYQEVGTILVIVIHERSVIGPRLPVNLQALQTSRKTQFVATSEMKLTKLIVPSTITAVLLIGALDRAKHLLVGIEPRTLKSFTTVLADMLQHTSGSLLLAPLLTMLGTAVFLLIATSVHSTRTDVVLATLALDALLGAINLLRAHAGKVLTAGGTVLLGSLVDVRHRKPPGSGIARLYRRLC
jgi:hypothetical protein